MSTPELAAVGDRDSIWMFKAFGVDTFFTDDSKRADEVLAQLQSEDYAVIFVTEDVFEVCREAIERMQDVPTTAVSVIPSVKGSRGLGLTQLREAIRVAVGTEWV